MRLVQLWRNRREKRQPRKQIRICGDTLRYTDAVAYPSGTFCAEVVEEGPTYYHLRFLQNRSPFPEDCDLIMHKNHLAILSGD